jgi:hypothetical protein
MVKPEATEGGRGGLADVPSFSFRFPGILRGLLAFWVLFAHLFAWSNGPNQGSVVGSTMVESTCSPKTAPQGQ